MADPSDITPLFGTILSAPPVTWQGARSAEAQPSLLGDGVAAGSALVGGASREAPAASPGGTSALVPKSGGSSTPEFLISHESSGKFDASNSASGAYGLGQFTAATAKTVAARHPELPGLSDFYSADPSVAVPAQRAYINAHVADQTKVLASQGLDPSPGNIHMNWFLGETGGPRFLKAMQENPNTVATTLASPEQVAANRSIFFKPDGTPRSASEVYGVINKASGGTSGGASGGASNPTQETSAWVPPEGASSQANPAELLAGEMKLAMLRGMFPQHSITPVEYDPFKALPKGLGGKVNVNEGVGG